LKYINWNNHCRRNNQTSKWRQGKSMVTVHLPDPGNLERAKRDPKYL
jgi:hypothetical protein